jgi:hypothetical protein
MTYDPTMRSKPHIDRAARAARRRRDTFAKIFEGEDGGDDIAKAHQHRGPHELGASLIQHLHDRLDRHREQHGYYTKAAKEQPMDTLLQIMKDGGIAGVCAQIVAKGSTTISEHELVDAATKVAAERYSDMSPAQAFSKVFTASTEEARVLQKAIAVAKAMPYLADLTPVMVGGEDTRDLSDQSKAIEQLKALGARRWPSARESDQFERALTDPANATLARRAVPRPAPTTSFPFPR